MLANLNIEYKQFPRQTGATTKIIEYGQNNSDGAVLTLDKTRLEYMLNLDNTGIIETKIFCISKELDLDTIIKKIKSKNFKTIYANDIPKNLVLKLITICMAYNINLIIYNSDDF